MAATLIPIRTTPTGRRTAGRRARREALLPFGITPSLGELFAFFLVRPNAARRLVELERLLGISATSLRRDLAHLVELGMLTRVVSGRDREVRYQVQPDHALWSVVRNLTQVTIAPVTLLESALRDIDGLQCAILFGSAAAGTDRAESDLDVLVVAGGGLSRQVARQLTEVSLIVGRSVSWVAYTIDEVAELLTSENHFMRNVFARPKVLLAGSDQSLRALATAARVPYARPGRPRAAA